MTPVFVLVLFLSSLITLLVIGYVHLLDRVIGRGRVSVEPVASVLPVAHLHRPTAWRRANQYVPPGLNGGVLVGKTWIRREDAFGRPYSHVAESES